MTNFSYKDWGGRTHRVIADYVRFAPGHINFWLDAPEPLNSADLPEVPGMPGKWPRTSHKPEDRLVLAVINTNVIELWEERDDEG